MVNRFDNILETIGRTPAAEKGSGMLAKAEELADAHSRTTAPEILADFEDTGLDYWITGS